MKNIRALDKIEQLDPERALDKLLQFYRQGPSVVLTQDEKRQLERAEFADEQLRQHSGNRRTVVNLLVNRYDVSQTEAYRIVQDAQWLFGQVEARDKNYERMIQLDIIERMLKLCEDGKDFKAVPALLKERRLLLDLDSKDEKPVDWDAFFKARTFELGEFPETLGVPAPADINARIKKVKQRVGIIKSTDHIPEADIDND